MAAFQYWFYDWTTKTLLDVLPVENTAATWEVNAPGTFTGDMPMYDPSLSPSRILAATQPVRTKLFVTRNTVPIWGGRLIEPRSYDSSTGRVTINAEETIGYFKYRFLPTLWLYGYDQIAIAENVLSNLQGVPGGSANLNVVAPGGMSGIMRDGVYSMQDFTDGLTAITDITEMEFGFEFGTQVAANPAGGMPIETLLLAYPRLGRIGPASPLVFDYNEGRGNVINYQWPDGPGLFTRTWADATTPDGVQLEAPYNASNLLNAGYPLLEQRVDYSSAKPTTLAQLQSYANKQGKICGQELVAATFTTIAQAGTTVVGDWRLGDDVMVRITDGRRFPAGPGGAPGFAGYMRISQAKLATDTSGFEQYQFTLDNYWGLATAG